MNKTIAERITHLNAMGQKVPECSREWWVQANINPTLELMHALGWQGGTIHQVCAALNCDVEDILYNGREKWEKLKERAK